MTGESVRLHSGFHRLHSCAILMAMALASAGLTAPDVYAQATAPAAPPAADQDRETKLKDTLSRLAGMSSADMRDSLEELLSGDQTSISAQVRVDALTALATAYERLAQEARSDTLDPGAGERVLGLIDRAVTTLNRLGQAAIERGDYPGAMAAFSRALSHQPRKPESLLGLARARAKAVNDPELKGNPLLALESYEAYLRSAKEDRVPVPPALYIEMGKLYASANLWNQAMKSYDEAQRSNYLTAELFGLRAEATMQLDTRRERKDKVIQDAQRAVELELDNPEHSIRLADLLLTLGVVQKGAWDPRFLSDAQAAAREAIEKAQRKVGAAAVSGTDKELGEALEQLIKGLAVGVRVLQAALKPEDLGARARLAGLVRGQAEVQARLAALQTLPLLDPPAGIEPTVELLEEKVRLQKLAQHRDLEATCKALLEKSPDNALAKETLAGLSK